MTSFPEVVLGIRIRCQQFIKYMVRTVPNFPKQTFISIVNWSSSSTKKWLDALAVSRRRKAPPRRSSVGELWDDDRLKDLLQNWCAHAMWTQDADSVHGPRTPHELMTSSTWSETDSFSVTVTPRTFSDATRAIPWSCGGGCMRRLFQLSVTLCNTKIRTNHSLTMLLLLCLCYSCYALKKLIVIGHAWML